MKLGVLGAMDCEIALLREKMELRETVSFAGIDYHLGNNGAGGAGRRHHPAADGLRLGGDPDGGGAVFF